MATNAPLRSDNLARPAIGLADHLGALRSSVGMEMLEFESALADLRRSAPAIQRPAHHVLGLPGKRLRPLCVVLAAGMGDGPGPASRNLALAVELIHDASLLHDDVIDVGEHRRGAPAARMLYGNAASIIAGNWLLTAALKRVVGTRLPGLLERTLGTIEEMVDAEALQLRNRGRLNVSREDYFRVLEGKTASLFRLALFGGAQAGGLPAARCRALERFGARMGVAFQLVDDLLDLTGNADVTGKSAFSDLREGKMTYPLLLALEQDASLRSLIETIAGEPGEPEIPAPERARILARLHAAGGVRECRARARLETRAAVAELDGFDEGPERTALIAVAEAIVDREG